MTFSTIKSKNYKILSIITGFESGKIDEAFIKNNSDYIFFGSTDVLKDSAEVNKIVLNNNLNICGIINGIDSTICYADFLVKKYLDEEVDLSYSKIRLNKNDVNICLDNNNIATIRGVELVSREDIDVIKKKLLDLNFPLVGKPTENTAAMAAFRVLYNMSDVDCYVQDFFQKKNPYYNDNVINKVVFQEYIDRLTNKEIVLDFVSYNGKHYCRGIVHYDKEIMLGRFPISRFYRVLSPSTNPELILLINYVKKSLDALRIRHGLTHNEVFYDGNSKALLVETNNRVAGGGLLELLDSTYGSNPINDYLKLISGDKLPEIEIKYNTIALDVYNKFMDNPENINISDLKSKVEILHFRNKKKIVSNYFENYSRVDYVNACLLLSNSSKSELDDDCKNIIHKEDEGSLFV